MFRLLLPIPVTIGLDVLAWGVIHAATGLMAHRIRPEHLTRDSWLLRPRRFEDGGQWYHRHLAIRQWKDRVPEAGNLFAGGISKSHLPTRDDAGLELFIRETRRAELAHWSALAAGPLLVLWNPWFASVLLVTYGVGVNLPFIAIQRYNRQRAQVALEARRARQAGSESSSVAPRTTRSYKRS